MPVLISKDEALRRVADERAGNLTTCLICAIGAGALGEQRVIAEGRHASLLLTAYPVRWGHLLVVLREHVTCFSELEPAAWLEASALAHRAARLLERALDPARCYVASLGASEERLVTTAHLHLHVVPVADPDDKPSQVFTWKNGVVSGEPGEWTALHALLRRHWSS